jgi:hypothetical protein
MLSIVHLYANQYGWTREYILDNVFVDEHFIHQKIIRDEQRQKILLDSQISLLPHLEQKQREKFFEMFEDDEDEEIKHNEQVSYEDTKKQLEEAKKMLQQI